MEGFDTLLEYRLLLLREERGADAHALFQRTHRVEWEHGDAVVHQLAGQLEVAHAWVLHGEVETVSQWGTKVIVIDEIEAVGQEHVLHVLGSAAILPHICQEVVLSVASSFHQRGHCMLNAVGRTT